MTDTALPARLRPCASAARRAAAVGLIAVAGLALSACSSGDAPAPSAEAVAQLEPQTITLYTSEPQAKLDDLISAFNEIHPEITVETYRAGTGDLTARIEAERAAGDIGADVLLAADAPTFEKYKSSQLLLQYSPKDVASLDEHVVDPDGYYTGTRIIPTVIAYNTTAVTTPPASWQDLADPQYARKITMPNPDVSGAAAYNAAVWLDEPSLGDAWLQRLAENKPVIVDSNGPVSQAVASGEQPIGVVVDYLVRDLAGQGSPIAVSYPSEGVPFVSEPAGIFADTQHAEASEALVDFLVSAEGQKVAVEQGYLPVRSDVGTPEGAPALADIKLLTPELSRIQATKKDAVARFNELFG